MLRYQRRALNVPIVDLLGTAIVIVFASFREQDARLRKLERKDAHQSSKTCVFLDLTNFSSAERDGRSHGDCSRLRIDFDLARMKKTRLNGAQSISSFPKRHDV